MFAVAQSLRQGCPLLPLLYILALEPLLLKLRDEAATPVLHEIAFPGGTQARVFIFVDHVTMCVSSCTDIKAVTKAFARYEEVIGAVFNCIKSVGLWLGV